MTDLNQYLVRLRDEPADPRLAEMDDAVMAGVTRRRERSAARRTFMLAGLLAVGVGWAGSMVPSTPAQASSAFMPMGMSDYAPSRLLGQ
jgi:hypothetical protein